MKGEVAEVLNDLFMSSKESDHEDERLVYEVKTVPCKSEELKKRK